MTAGGGTEVTTTHRRRDRATALRCVLLAALVLGGSACSKDVGESHDGVPPDAAGDATGASPDTGSCSSVDTTSDVDNCGACGHSCGGGACVASSCQPVALAVDQDTPTGLAVDAANVYWTTADGNVMKVPIAGGSATVVASGQRSPWGVAVDATNIYWVNAVSPGQVMSVPIIGGAPTMLADHQRRPVHVAIADGIVYWTNSGSGTVMSLPVTGGTPTQLADKQGALVAIAVDSHTLYWSSVGQGVIRALSLGEGGTIATIADDQDAVALFVRDATVYWANAELVDDMASVFALPAGGAPVALGSGPGPYAAVADGHSVYWTDEILGAVLRVPATGGDTSTIASDQPGASELAIDAANLYWLAAASGAVMKLAK